VRHHHGNHFNGFHCQVSSQGGTTTTDCATGSEE
jgi:hypothetical protein